MDNYLNWINRTSENAFQFEKLKEQSLFKSPRNSPSSRNSTPDRLNNAAIHLSDDDDVIAPTQMNQTPPKQRANRQHTFRRPLFENEKENRTKSPFKCLDIRTIKLERQEDQTPVKSFLCDDTSNTSSIESSMIIGSPSNTSNDEWASKTLKRRIHTPKRLTFSAKKRSAGSSSHSRRDRLMLKQSSPRLKQSTINFQKAFPIEDLPKAKGETAALPQARNQVRIWKSRSILQVNRVSSCNRLALGRRGNVLRGILDRLERAHW